MIGAENEVRVFGHGDGEEVKYEIMDKNVDEAVRDELVLGQRATIPGWSCNSQWRKVYHGTIRDMGERGDDRAWNGRYRPVPTCR